MTRPGDYNAPPEYDTMHYMTYADMAAVDVYFHHPAHKRFIERNRDSWDGVLVMNSEI